jgi:hypothetical protein
VEDGHASAVQASVRRRPIADDDRRQPKPMRKRAEFRRHVDLLLAECEAQGVILSREAAEDLLADRVRHMAAALRLREDTIVRSYLSTIDPASLVEGFRIARATGERELADTPPTVVDLASAGCLIASLGQAVRCVSLNHDKLTASAKDVTGKWTAIGVLDDASNGLTLLGAALEHTDVAAGRVSVLLSDEAVLHTRRALAQTVQNLTVGAWSFGHEPEVDTGVAERMAADLALLPPG